MVKPTGRTHELLQKVFSCSKTENAIHYALNEQHIYVNENIKGATHSSIVLEHRNTFLNFVIRISVDSETRCIEKIQGLSRGESLEYESVPDRSIWTFTVVDFVCILSEDLNTCVTQLVNLVSDTVPIYKEYLECVARIMNRASDFGVRWITNEWYICRVYSAGFRSLPLGHDAVVELSAEEVSFIVKEFSPISLCTGHTKEYIMKATSLARSYFNAVADAKAGRFNRTFVTTVSEDWNETKGQEFQTPLHTYPPSPYILPPTEGIGPVTCDSLQQNVGALARKK